MAILKFICVLICVKIVQCKLNIDIKGTATPGEVVVDYSGIETNVVTKKDIQLFKIDDKHLKNAVAKHYGKRPTSVFVKSPTPWGDLYKEHHWEQVTKVVLIKSARVKALTLKPVIVSTQNLGNPSNKTTKAIAGITQTVENSITTSWSTSNEFTISQEFEYDVNVIFEKASASIGLSYTVNWGKGEERSEKVSIGTSTSAEVELGPRQEATAVLSANRGFIEVEVVYEAKLRGNVAVNYRKKYNGHHFWGPSIVDVMQSGGLSNEKTTTETIKIAFYSDATLKVYDKETNKPL